MPTPNPPPGVIVTAAEISAAIPSSISKLQAVLTMAATPGSLPGKTLLDDVELFVGQADTVTKLAWKHCGDLERNSRLVTTIGQALNKTSAAIDDLFNAASKVVV